MTEREQKLEEILTKLLTQHFFLTSLEWNYPDGVTLQEKDIDLYLEIAKEVPEAILFHKE